MIRKLQALRARKGFTIVELVVVMAIIGVLMAVILPAISSANSRKQEARSAAQDFYAAVQTIMTKYSLYEGPLSPAYQVNPNLGEIRYYEKMGGNYPYKAGTAAGEVPATTSLYVEFTTKNGDITNVYTYAEDASDSNYANGVGLYHLCERSAANNNTEFGRLLRDEVAKRISYQDGYYYAKITYRNIVTGTIPQKMEAETVKVEYTGFGRRPLPSAAGKAFTAWSNSVMFGDDYRLADGEIFGVSASYNATTGGVVGLAGSKLT